METTVYNTAKQRLETINIEITKENSTWFEDDIDMDSVYKSRILKMDCWSHSATTIIRCGFMMYHGLISAIAVKRHKIFCKLHDKIDWKNMAVTQKRNFTWLYGGQPPNPRDLTLRDQSMDAGWKAVPG